MKLRAVSHAGYTSWYYIEALKLLLDAGEGVNAALEGKALALREVVLTHAHTDHYAGLLALLGSRSVDRFTRGHDLGPLRLTYPAGSATFESLWRFFAQHIHGWRDLVTLHPVEPGQRWASLTHNAITLVATPARHMPDEPCIGVRLDHGRTKLRPDVVALPQAERVARIRAHGAAALSTLQHAPLLAYSGDSAPCHHPDTHGVHLLIHDATFLAPHTADQHATLEGAVRLAHRLQARHLLLCHISTRYTPEALQYALARALKATSYQGHARLFMPREELRWELRIPGL